MISKYLDISTLHIKPETLKKDSFHKIASYEYGSIYWISEELEVEKDSNPDLLTILAYAKDRGCRLVVVDADAEMISELPVYWKEWGETPPVNDGPPYDAATRTGIYDRDF